MRRLAAIASVLVSGLASWSCTDSYLQNDFELLAANRARSMCTCLFTSKMEEPWCDTVSGAPVPITTYTVDDENKRVESQLGLMWSDRARFVSERFGCIFE